ncbi:isochorismatase hydrolase [Candidatus Koribacter versatilis Ellin345]|uniref:Isochorismatase hydrolase n=1 Tax=Koribacter versatilis (strain Ellin345) TaxID=204669 RepID=Q1ITX6_KORVE|nr:hydrolase [Candidatus Koribacter versatilis]ABF39674.1 isochorismatase hydrolase [Candidatus Koribacter versatilis Ellin345]
MTPGSIELTLDPHEIARRPLDPQQCALVVVDIQEKLLPSIANKELLVKNAQLLIRLAGMLELPTVLSTQYKRGLGETVPEIASLLPHAITLDKTEFGCFNNEGFCSAVKTLPGNRTTVLLCGMETHICVMQTALGAMSQGYIVHVASDAVGSRSEWNYHIGLNRMQDAGAVISSTEMMMYELLRSSSSAVFKELLPYLKG